MLENNYAVILAAGKGTRMQSQRPKVMQTLLGDSMLALVLHACEALFHQRIIIVSGYAAHTLESAFPTRRFVRQERQLGTGHALMTALPELQALGAAHATIINGDCPLLDAKTLDGFLRMASGADLAFATIVLPDAGAYGRVVRSGNSLVGIVEAKDFAADVHGHPTGEVNAGIYSINLEKVLPLVSRLDSANAGGEYYITDLVRLALDAGLDVRGIALGEDATLLGVNSPQELAEAENMLAMRTVRSLMSRGVIVHAPQLARVSPLAVIEPGVELTGPCEISGKSCVESGASIASHCVIRDSIIHANAEIRPFCHLERAEVGETAIVGPYTRLRPGASLEQGAHAGNFVELKNARLGQGAKANHLTYLGDAEIGARTNIGAGTITCNYDGHAKHRTAIGADAFIGSNTALVAPIAVGDRALVGAGSTLTRDVPPDELAIARTKQKNLPRRKL